MKKPEWKTYAFWIASTEIVGAISGFLTREGAELYKLTIEKPPLSPPGWLFPMVWGILYALMGIGAARVYLAEESREQSRALKLYIAQLALNFFWSIIFFNMQRFGLALIWLLTLWLLILLILRAFSKVNEAAARMQIPYLLWTTFAAYLNLGVWILNK